MIAGNEQDLKTVVYIFIFKIINLTDVAEVEELPETGFTDHADSVGMSFFLSIYLSLFIYLHNYEELYT